MKLYKIFFEA